MKRLVLTLLLALAGLVALAPPAGAHAAVDSTTPASGAVLQAPPEELVIRFNQRVAADDDSLQLHDASGARVPVGELERADGGRTLRVPVRRLEEGGYVVTYRVVSEDGHAINGGVTWRLGRAAADVDQTVLEELLNAEGGETTVRAVAAATRGLLFAALIVLVGGLVFVLAIWPAGAADARMRRVLVLAGAVAVVTTAFGAGLQGAETSGGSLGDALLPRAAVDTLDTDFGRAALARLVLVAVLTCVALVVTSARARSTPWRLGTLAASAGALLTLTLSGHARTGRWLTLAVPLDLVHLGAAAVWIGGLAVVALVVLPRGDEADSGVVEARFSRVALAAVAAVVGTGTVQGLRQLGELEGLRTTSYGRLLVMKVAAVAVVVVLGALSRSLVRARLAPPVEGEDGDVEDPADLKRALRRSVGAEVAIAAVVLGLTSLLVAADPARSEEARAFVESRVVDGSILEVQVAPARPGPADVHVYVVDQSIPLTTAIETTAELTLPGSAFEGIEVPIRPAGGRHWSAYDVELPASGDWRLEVVVRIGRFDERRATFTVRID